MQVLHVMAPPGQPLPLHAAAVATDVILQCVGLGGQRTIKPSDFLPRMAGALPFGHARGCAKYADGSTGGAERGQEPAQGAPSRLEAQAAASEHTCVPLN
eukprot:COSAG05_NODE_5284_length_1215_cov_2.697133_2_plen_100_part_00